MAYSKNPVDAKALRHLAKVRLAGRLAHSVSSVTQPELKHLFEELQIHQVELELQNEQLDAARSQLELALNESCALYDFSPVGSVSLDASGQICKLNLAAASLLGGERGRLMGVRFALYVSGDDLPAFNAMLDGVKKTGVVQKRRNCIGSCGITRVLCADQGVSLATAGRLATGAGRCHRTPPDDPQLAPQRRALEPGTGGGG
jgi:hypothetical protein